MEVVYNFTNSPRDNILGELKDIVFNLTSWRKFDKLRKNGHFKYSKKILRNIQNELLLNFNTMKMEGKLF